MSEARLNTTARKLIDLRRTKEAAEQAFDKAKAEFTEAERDFWMDLKELGRKSFHADLGEGYGEVRLVPRETVTARILDKDALVAALETEGLDDGMLGTPEIRKKALNEHIRDLNEAGQEFPEGVDIHSRKYFTMTFK